MPGLLDIDGLNQAIDGLTTVRDELPDELALGFYEVLEPMRDKAVTYPEPRQSDPNRVYVRGVGMKYLPTGHQSYTSEKFGASSYIGVQRFGREIMGYIAFPASYSSYVIGNMQGYLGAWMHLGRWRPIKDIVNRGMTWAVARLDARVQQLINRAGL